MKVKKLAGFAIAASFAMLSTSALAAHHADNKMMKCYGLTNCQGEGVCKSADSNSNSCKQNTCKDNGYVMVSKMACEQLGGMMKTAANSRAINAAQAQQQQAQAQAQPGQQAANAINTNTDQNQ